jgi:glycine cleavage system aminomethyltransferase T
MSAGKEFGLKSYNTCSIRRIEGAMLSYHADADINTNPYELGLDRLVNLDIEANFVGKEALKKIKNVGVKRKQAGVIIDSKLLEGPITTFWPITKNNKIVGKITSAIYSPRLKKNIALAMVSINSSDVDTVLEVEISSKKNKVTVVEKPFNDPKKKLVNR